MTCAADHTPSTQELLEQALRDAYERGCNDGKNAVYAEIRNYLEGIAPANAGSPPYWIKKKETPANAHISPEMHLDDFGLSERPRNCLRRAQIDILDVLIQTPASTLMRITNFGDKSLEELVQRFIELDLRVPVTWSSYLGMEDV